MQSAFGVEHGYDEVSKAIKPPGVGAALGGGFRALGAGMGQAARTGAGNMGRMAGKNVGAGGMRGALGQGQIKVGQGLKRFSGMAMRRPGAVAGGAAGVAGVGAVGTGAATNSMMNRNKRLSQYR